MNKISIANHKLFGQLFPVAVCLVLFLIFIVLTNIFISYGINPYSNEKIELHLHLIDVSVGFFLYFVTAIDYALIVGRMQSKNPGLLKRFAMNVFTCLGCFVGVSVVLFLWGFAKEITWLIVPLLVIAGSVMIKLAYEGHDYFAYAQSIPAFIRNFTMITLRILYTPTKIFTFWMPELGSPRVENMSIWKLSQWSFFLPFIIGIDDLVGYMGAMTIYNAYGLLFGIYLADILIDILIFVSPGLTKKLVENAILSLLAVYAFLYLGYKSFAETYHILQSILLISPTYMYVSTLIFLVLVLSVDYLKYKIYGTKTDHVRGK